jgi:hypothetical protein
MEYQLVNSAVIDRVFEAGSQPQFDSIRGRVVTDATEARSASYGDMPALGRSSHGGAP